MSDDNAFLFGMFLMAAIAIIGIFIVSYSHQVDIQKLGTAICEKKYNSSFKSFDGETLKCEPKVGKYDGIKVLIGA